MRFFLSSSAMASAAGSARVKGCGWSRFGRLERRERVKRCGERDRFACERQRGVAGERKGCARRDKERKEL